MGKLSRFIFSGLLSAVILTGAGHPASSSGRPGPAPGPAIVHPAGAEPGPSVSKEEALRAAAEAKQRIESRATRESLDGLARALAGLKTADDWNNLGVTLWLAGRHFDAVVVLAAAAQKSPDDFLPFNNLAAALTSVGDGETALLLLGYAAGLAPGNPVVLTNTGTAHHEAGQTDQAAKAWEEAVAADPHQIEANYSLGVLHHKRGDAQKAESYLRNSLLGGYTNRAARILDKITRQSDRAPVLPPVPAAANAPLDVRLPRLPDSLKDFMAGEDEYKAEVERVLAEVNALNRKAAELAMSRPREEKSERLAAKPGRYAVSGRKARLGLREAGRIREAVDRMARDMGDYFKEILPRQGNAETQNENKYIEEERQCDKLSSPSAKSACHKAARDRFCGRHYAMTEPLYKEIADWYQGFAGEWETQVRDYLGRVNYWAGYLPRAEAAYERCVAQKEAARYYWSVHRFLRDTSRLLKSQTECDVEDAPPPPVGTFDISEFEVPCSFGGFQIGIGIVSLDVDCRAVTLSGTLGFLSGELEWDFVSKNATILIGVGASVSTPGVELGSASATAGVFVSIDRDGSIADSGGYWKVGAEASAAGLGASKSLGGIGAGGRFRMGLCAGLQED